MTRAALAAIAILAAAPDLPAAAEETTAVAARAIRSQTVLGPDDVAEVAGATPGAFASAEEAIGLEARVALYPGRPLRPGELGPPALLERNQLVIMTFARGALSIVAEGRALGRAGLGERVRVLNLDSKATVTGTVTGPGQVEVGR